MAVREWSVRAFIRSHRPLFVSMTSSPRRASKLLRLLAISAVLALVYGLALSSLSQKSPTFDEQGFIVRGLAYLRSETEGGTRRIRVGHPPGLNAYTALLLADDESVRLPVDDPSWSGTSFHRPAELFLWEIGNDVSHILFLARIPTVWLGLLLLALITRWAAAVAGRGIWLRPGSPVHITRAAAGLLALVLAAFDPNLLAHTRLATTDFGLTATAALAGYGVWRLARRPSSRTAVLAGVGVGLMVNTKFTALLFLPFFAAVLLAALVVQWRVAGARGRGILLPMLVIFPTVAFLVLWAGNGFDVGRLPAEMPFLPQLTGLPVPLAHYLEQLLDIGGRLSVETLAFLLGQYRTTGWWTYFPVAFLLKTPLPVLILLAAAVIATMTAVWARRKRLTAADGIDLAALLLPPAGFFGIALTTDINLGYRHILPVLPFLYVFMGAALGGLVAWLIQPSLSPAPARTRLAGGVTLTMTGLLIAVSLWIYPHYLAFFNVLAGGPDNGWRALVDSNLDWGQDLQALGPWMADNGVERVWLSYFGEARPEYYGIVYDGLDSFPPRLMNPDARPFVPSDPAPGWYALSATNLQGVHFFNHDQFRFFRDSVPDAKLGYSIFLYNVPARGAPVNLVLSGLQPDEVAPQDFAQLGTNDVTLRWVDGARALILPDNGRPTWLMGAADLEALWPAQLAGADRRPSARPDSYTIWQLRDVAPVAKVLETFTSTGGAVDLLDATTVEQEGRALQIETTWRQQGDPAPVKMFIHVLDDAGQIVAQWDGLDVAWEGWRAGDVLYQHHTLDIPPAPGGTYRVVAGLYDPDSLARWTTTAGADTVLLTELSLP
jgi:hypothetical protein